MIRYKHAQFGWVIVIGALIALVISVTAILAAQSSSELLSPTLLVALMPLFVILLFIILFFYNLYTEITDTHLKVAFGIGLIKKIIPLDQIVNSETREKQMTLGWGIRFHSEFTLWNVSGFDSVEITLRDQKRKLRIGTDRAVELNEAIQAVLRARQHSATAG